MYFIDTILPLSLSQTFTYQVTQDEYDYLQMGFRVAVPFGKNKIYTALVVNKHNKQPLAYDAKEIHQIIDEAPSVFPNQIKHWFWISEYYMCAIGEVYRAAMPSSLLLESETIIKNKIAEFVALDTLSDDEYLLYEAFQRQNILKISEVANILDKKNVLPIIKKLLEKGLLEIDEKVKQKYKPKLVKCIRLSKDYRSEGSLEKLLDVTGRAPKQKEMVLGYFQLQAQEVDNQISSKQLQTYIRGTASTIKVLVEKGVFELYHLQEDRVVFGEGEEEGVINLSVIQESVYNKVIDSLQNKNVCLLKGEVASGRMLVYARMIKDYLEKEKQVLFLVPEAVLTTQAVRFFQKYFGKKVTIYNSKYSNSERVEVWNAVLTNKVQLIIGTRSSVFLPFLDLGLVIVDEEHEASYKQHDPAPRFQARDTAVVLANYCKAKIVLGSETPSVESYYNATNDKYGLVRLNNNEEVVAPKITLVDVKDNYKRKKMSGHFSQDLIEQITEKLALKEQVVLFQNKRGYSPMLECETCGHIPQCTQCNVSLTYHKNKNQLQCHYCGFSIVKPRQCHACSSTELTTKGFGTEQIELEVKELFPEARVARMDKDTTTGKYAFERLLDALAEKEIDILIGTQMVTKSVGADNVSLIGVLNADNMLYYPDFRSFERTFQVLTQVSERVKGTRSQGDVFFQTYSPAHSVIKQVVQKDYVSLYNDQLQERKEFKYPPYYKLIKVVLKHKDFEKLKEASHWYFNVLKQNLPIPIYGPEEPSVNRIRNQYIRVIQLKIPNTVSLVRVKEILKKTHKSFDAIGAYKSIKTTIDVDYY